MRSQPCIGFGNGARSSLRCMAAVCMWLENQHRACFSVAAAIDGNHSTVSDLRLCSNRRFQILGIDVHSLSGDDHVFLTAFEVQVSRCIESTEVASTKPFTF